MACVSRRGPGWAVVCECCTRVHESLRVFASVCRLSELPFMGFRAWAVITAGKGAVERVVTSVCESSREMHERLRAVSVCTFKVGSSRAMSDVFPYSLCCGSAFCVCRPVSGLDSWFRRRVRVFSRNCPLLRGICCRSDHSVTF